MSLSVAPLVKMTSSGLAATTRGDLLARAVDPLLGDLAVAVGTAAGVAELVGHEAQHLVRDAGIHRCGRVEVHVDRPVGLVGRSSASLSVVRRYGHVRQPSRLYGHMFGLTSGGCSEVGSVHGRTMRHGTGGRGTKRREAIRPPAPGRRVRVRLPGDPRHPGGS